MCGRAILLLLFSFSFPITAASQCDYRLESSSPFRFTYLDLATEGNDLWAATGYGVQLLDRGTDPPRPLGGVALPGVTRAIDARDGVAYAASGTAVHVLRRTASGLELIRSIDTGATVNDILVAGGALFAATASGLLRFERADPLHPSGSTTLPTSSSNVLSLARSETQLYAADGDSTVERFTLSGGGATAAGTLAGLPRSASVAVSGTFVFVSDGQQTRVFAADGSPMALFSYGASTVTHHAGSTYFIAGSDRRFRAVDLALAAGPVELYAADIIPNGGNVNRVGAMIAAGSRLYVAGGDAGLVVVDTSGFAAPFALRSHPLGPKTSSADSAAAVFVGEVTGGLTELTRFSSGTLAVGRTWGGSQLHLVHDFANDFLLTSAGAVLTYWTTRSGPAVVTSASMGGAVRAAALSGTTALVLLVDGTLWSVDLTREQPAPSRIMVDAAAHLARSERGVALASVSQEGVTEVRYYPGANFTAAPKRASVAGAATALAIDAETVATFTFGGITVVDFSGAVPVQAVLPSSNALVVRDLAIAGDRLLDVTATTLRVWNLRTRRLDRSFILPSSGQSLSLHPAAPVATVLTDAGVVTIDYQVSSRQPQESAVVGANRYFTRVQTTQNRLFAFWSPFVEVFDNTRAGAPRHLATLSFPGAIDFAASDDRLFILYSSSVVSAYTHSGSAVGTTSIQEGADTLPLAIAAVRGAAWVSYSRGCMTTGCEEKTAVLDPVSLVRTATIEGGVTKVISSGTAAHLLAHVPPVTELRSYDLSNPLHPVLTASRTAEGSAADLSRHGETVLVLGTRLFSYSHPLLSKLGEELPPVPVSSATALTTSDRCAVLTGRSSSAELYWWSGANWLPSGLLPLPGPARAMAGNDGRIVILTDYSMEIWSRTAPPPPSRRRIAQ